MKARPDAVSCDEIVAAYRSLGGGEKHVKVADIREHIRAGGRRVSRERIRFALDRAQAKRRTRHHREDGVATDGEILDAYRALGGDGHHVPIKAVVDRIRRGGGRANKQKVGDLLNRAAEDGRIVRHKHEHAGRPERPEAVVPADEREAIAGRIADERRRRYDENRGLVQEAMVLPAPPPGFDRKLWTDRFFATGA